MYEALLWRDAGSIPSSWSGNSNLKHVNLSNNTLTGSLPPEWASLNQLQTLNASQNLFSGTIPSNWRNSSLLNGTTSEGMSNLTSL